MVALKELSCCQHCQNDQAANFHGGFLFYFLVCVFSRLGLLNFGKSRQAVH